MQTSFALVYDSFLSKVTDDMYLELTELDTYRMLEELLLSAIEKFEFPRINLLDYELFEVVDEINYNGAESNYQDTLAIVYDGGYFNNYLTHEQINILAIYMIVEWLSQQLASIQNTRMKYSGSDFKFTSQANHMAKILQLKKDYQREGFHMQRLYKRRIQDRFGIMRSTLWKIMAPVEDSGQYKNATDDRARWRAGTFDYNQLINKPKIESVTLVDNKTFEDLDLSRITQDELNEIFSSSQSP